MKPLYLDMNLGLGDAIICNGLVRWLHGYHLNKPGAHYGRKMILPSYLHNLSSVQHMFSDLPNLRVVLHDGRFVGHDDEETLSIGLSNPRWGEVQPFDRAFYEFAGVPFDAKWDLFHAPESGTEIAPPEERPFVLFHHDPKRGFKIDCRKIKGISGDDLWINKEESPRITDWRYIIRDAAEIHCIDSAVMHLAELLPTTGKLFYHKYARPAAERHSDAIFRKDWTVIE